MIRAEPLATRPIASSTVVVWMATQCRLSTSAGRSRTSIAYMASPGSGRVVVQGSMFKVLCSSEVRGPEPEDLILVQFDSGDGPVPVLSEGGPKPPESKYPREELRLVFNVRS